MSQIQMTTTSTVCAVQDQVSADLAGEAVILNLKSGMYYGLNPVGARVWQLIQQPQTLNEVQQTILNEYEVEPARCEQDILNLINDLAANGLIEIQHDVQS